MDEVEKMLNEIIDTAQLDADLKTCLKKSLNAIYSHEKKIISELKSEVETELKSGRNFLPIVTALVPREKIPAMSERNFYAVDKALFDKNLSIFFKTPPAFDVKKFFDESNSESYFLCCPYEEVEELCKKTFVGRNGAKTFSYRLVPQKRLVE